MAVEQQEQVSGPKNKAPQICFYLAPFKQGCAKWKLRVKKTRLAVHAQESFQSNLLICTKYV